LCIWILVSDSLFQRSHGFFGRHGFGSDDVGDLKIQRDVLPGKSHQVSKGLGGAQLEKIEVAYKLLLVAFSICSSKAVLAVDDHQLIIFAPVSVGWLDSGVRYQECGIVRV